MIGVVADVRYGGLAVTESSGEVFVSTRQMQFVQVFSSTDSFLAVRTIGDPLTVVPFLAEAVAEAHPRATIDDMMTMEARLSAAVAQPRFHAGFVGFFLGLARFLPAFGIYALLSYTVEQRRREIGVPMALGAQRRRHRGARRPAGDRAGGCRRGPIVARSQPPGTERDQGDVGGRGRNATSRYPSGPRPSLPAS